MVTMYDSTDAQAVPLTGWDLLAGYVNGRYRSAGPMRSRFPSAVIVTIDVLNHPGVADVLDIEAGDATPEDGPAWFDQSKAMGIPRPTLYFPFSLWPRVRAAMGSRVYDKWVAAYGVAACPLPGAVAWQKADHGPHGENVDISEVYDLDWPHRIGGNSDMWDDRQQREIDGIKDQVRETDAAVNRLERFARLLADKEGIVYPAP